MLIGQGGTLKNSMSIIDSGCSNHMTKEKSHFMELDETQIIKNLQLKEDGQSPSTQLGDM